ncbi:pentatricopeptide repeat-containing protein At1g05670, mitochondrial-like [Humulus lupulus]|uniref:pentatricopeptide repeat-containing protein At1g05670, mitochondrial-like n=1 Tax=Humulus lupulus TaxID=3486 RepID=UPI002B405A5F|nr:pentatricopeptide repeat-containing protein At1g05670, mitochondrial-like [Humulus lupulus]
MAMGVPSLKNEFRYLSRSRLLFSLIFHIPQPHTASPLPFPAIFLDLDQFRSNSLCNLPNSLISSSGSFSVSAPKFSIFGHGIELVSPRRCKGLRPFSASSSKELSNSGTLKRPSSAENACVRNPGPERTRSKAFWKKAWEIVDWIKGGENDLEFKLNGVNVSLSNALITLILQLLNSEKVSALRFYNWIKDSRPGLGRNYDICSLIVDNCGRLSDYETMTCTLNEFSKKGICLTQNAFWFIPELTSNGGSLKNYVSEVVMILNGVGGTCRSSGVGSLIQMFSSLGSFKMAKFVMEITEMNTTYYNIMIKETCRRCDIEGSRALVHEMRQLGCKPNVTSYNLFLSNLCKSGERAEELLKEIKAMDCSPNELTFEIIISHLCEVGQFDLAIELLDNMMLRGLKPRLTTHAVFVRGYFKVRRYEEAHKYVVDACFKHSYSSNVVYSLLADLYLNQKDLVSAQTVISEMIGKGLRPSIRVYMTLLKGLQSMGRDDEARDLEKRFSSLDFKDRITETG